MSSEASRTDGWQAHRRLQLEQTLTSTHAERLRWLEEAINFAFEAGALPQPRPTDGGTSRRSGTEDPAG